MSVDAKPREVAEHLGMHPETVRQLTREGAFPNAYKTGRGGQSNHIRIPWTDVEDYRKRQPRASA
ncbi:MAG: helix-turn-helix domain-containing protein [Actinomycetota bacterium]|nr:helix-turn-helix domain-containing protein [Actinomycetota bacterium]